MLLDYIASLLMTGVLSMPRDFHTCENVNLLATNYLLDIPYGFVVWIAVSIGY